MKPRYQFSAGKRQFPLTDYSYHRGIGEWHGYSSPYDGDERSEVHRFHSFTREFLTEASRERAKETAVFGLVVLTAAWPLVYMVVTLVKLLLTGRPLDQ